MKLHFYKYQGTGNDFIMIDNRSSDFPKKDVKIIEKLCDRRFGIGADGLILLEQSINQDFSMVYFNADGNEGSMCGNGGRCLVAFARQLGVISNETTFDAVDGLHYASIENGIISLKMIDVSEIQKHNEHSFLNTGSPHQIRFCDSVAAINVKETGAKIRYGAPYFEEGTNVNFAEKIDANTFKIRTYERGVEDETLSCGTGVTAVALAMHHIGKTEKNLLTLQTPGGNLKVSFDKQNDYYKNIWLIGPAIQVYKGEIEC